MKRRKPKFVISKPDTPKSSSLPQSAVDIFDHSFRMIENSSGPGLDRIGEFYGVFRRQRKVPPFGDEGYREDILAELKRLGPEKNKQKIEKLRKDIEHINRSINKRLVP